MFPAVCVSKIVGVDKLINLLIEKTNAGAIGWDYRSDYKFIGTDRVAEAILPKSGNMDGGGCIISVGIFEALQGLVNFVLFINAKKACSITFYFDQINREEPLVQLIHKACSGTNCSIDAIGQLIDESIEHLKSM